MKVSESGRARINKSQPGWVTGWVTKVNRYQQGKDEQIITGMDR